MSGNDDSQGPTEEDKTPAGAIDVDDVSRAAVNVAAIREASEVAKMAAREASDSQRLAASALTDAQAKLAEITTAVTQAVAAMTKIVDDQAVIAAKSAHIQDAQVHADGVRANLDRTATGATQLATEAEGMKARAQTAADNAAQLLTEVRTTKGTVEADAGAVAAALKAAEESAGLAKGLADKSATIETRIADYEGQLADLKGQCATQLRTIEGLLPGAASAGLAHSFDERRHTFLSPRKKWENWYVGSMALIAVLAVVNWWQAYHGGVSPTWDESLLLWLVRLPVAAPFIWLAIHSSHEAALAKRLEEDYGYKVAVASSFMGFHKQMMEVGTAASSNVPLAKLCNDTLSTIASPPGRIYEKHKLTVSPSRELKEAAETLVAFVKAGMKPTG